MTPSMGGFTKGEGGRVRPGEGKTCLTRGASCVRRQRSGMGCRLVPGRFLGREQRFASWSMAHRRSAHRGDSGAAHREIEREREGVCV